jgi:hypothetical protein
MNRCAAVSPLALGCTRARKFFTIAFTTSDHKWILWRLVLVSTATGIILTCFVMFLIVEPITLALLPFAFLLNRVVYNVGNGMFDEEGLTVLVNRSDYFFYLLAYCLNLQPTCLWGYITEFLNMRKT